MVSIETASVIGVLLGVALRYGVAYYNKTQADAKVTWDHRYTLGLALAVASGILTAPEVLATLLLPTTTSVMVAFFYSVLYAAGLGHIWNLLIDIGK